MADIFARIDKNGVVQFTNIRKGGGKWKRIMRTYGPGKARVVHSRRRKALSKARYDRYDKIIAFASLLYHIPEPLIRAVIRVESDFDEQAVSRAGACGLMQLLRSTAQALGVRAIFDPWQNIFGGVRYLRQLANRFGGDLIRTLAAYHAGPTAVRRYRGVPPYETTHRYIKMVVARYKSYTNSGIPQWGHIFSYRHYDSCNQLGDSCLQ